MSTFQVVAIWWPDGWEPLGPLDVPNCVSLASSSLETPPLLDYEKAVATVRGLNRQHMDHPGTTWHVVAEIGAGAPGEEAGTMTTGGLRIIRPTEGGGKGDCSCCPAHALPCAE